MYNSLSLRSARRRLQSAQKGGYSQPQTSPQANVTINSFSTLSYSHYDRSLDGYIGISDTGEEVAFESLTDGETGSFGVGDRVLYSQGFGSV